MDGPRRPTLDALAYRESAQALEETPARDWRFTSGNCGNCANSTEPTRRRESSATGGNVYAVMDASAGLAADSEEFAAAQLMRVATVHRLCPLMCRHCVYKYCITLDTHASKALTPRVYEGARP
jgi:hypothetical protein